MEEILNFIYANYVWIIGGVIIILMALIGYIADKTNFGRKDTNSSSKKNQNDESSSDKKEEAVIEQKKESNIFTEEKGVSDLLEETKKEIDSEIKKDDVNVDDLNILENGFADESNSKIDLTPNIEDNSLVDDIVKENMDIKEETSNELKDDDVNEKEEIKNDLEDSNEVVDSKINLEDVKLPKLDEIKDENSDDDVWQF